MSLFTLNGTAQKSALDTFHFGLRPNGLLFLGSPESVDEGTRLFAPLNKKHRLYIRQTTSSARPVVPSKPPFLELVTLNPATDAGGIGIAPEALSTIFEAFTQGGEQIGHKFGGLGLGLTIAKSIISAHGGTLHAESEGVAKGAASIFRLPLTNS